MHGSVGVQRNRLQLHMRRLPDPLPHRPLNLQDLARHAEMQRCQGTARTCIAAAAAAPSESLSASARAAESADDSAAITPHTAPAPWPAQTGNRAWLASAGS